MNGWVDGCQTIIHSGQSRGVSPCLCLPWGGVNCTRVTDDGLAHLKELSKLESLALWRTQVTGAGIAELKKPVPGLGTIQ